LVVFVKDELCHDIEKTRQMMMNDNVQAENIIGLKRHRVSGSLVAVAN